MFLQGLHEAARRRSFLRASGGVSSTRSFATENPQFSPRKRRCFLRFPCKLPLRTVFSAQAEVFLSPTAQIFLKIRFLRASGGVSPCLRTKRTLSAFSPRKRRCFFHYRNNPEARQVFSAQAEVFLEKGINSHISRSFLRASGGVSKFCGRVLLKIPFSPRKRRCFHI